MQPVLALQRRDCQVGAQRPVAGNDLLAVIGACCVIGIEREIGRRLRGILGQDQVGAGLGRIHDPRQRESGLHSPVAPGTGLHRAGPDLGHAGSPATQFIQLPGLLRRVQRVAPMGVSPGISRDLTRCEPQHPDTHERDVHGLDGDARRPLPRQDPAAAADGHQRVTVGRVGRGGHLGIPARTDESEAGMHGDAVVRPVAQPI